MHKTTLDSRNLEERELDWIDLMLEMYNDPDVVIKTPSVSCLHIKFREQINSPKGGYKVTREKCRTMIGDQKTKLRVMICEYNLSGNGSDMTNFDKDTDDKEDGSPQIASHFNG